MSSARLERLILLPDPRALPAVQEEIAAAKQSIDVAMFWFDHRSLAEALLAARRRGVQVRVLADRRSLRGMAKEDGSRTWMRSVPGHLTRGGVPVAIYQGKDHIMHHKFLLIDRAHGNGRIVLTTWNWHLEDLQNNHDALLALRDPVAMQRLGTWFDEAYGAARQATPRGTRLKVMEEGFRHGVRSARRAVRRRLRDPFKQRREPDDPNEGHGAPRRAHGQGRPEVRPGRAGPESRHLAERSSARLEAGPGVETEATLYLSDDMDLAGVIEREMARASHEVVILHSTVRWERLPGIVGPLTARDVTTRILAGALSPDLQARLLAAGAEVLRFRPGRARERLHHKIVLIDRKTVLLGTVNLFPRSLHQDRELLYVLRSAPLALTIGQEADRLWTASGGSVPAGSH